MNPEELIAVIRRDPARVLPLVGAGLAIDAGAPSAAEVAAELIRRFDLGDPSLNLDAAAQAAEAGSDRLSVQKVVAETVARTRPRSTAALTALAAGPVQMVLTTNYDDAIEQAVRDRGGVPISLRATDQHILDPPEVAETYVVHLHGKTDDPSSIILPGGQMEELAKSELFQRLLTGAMIPRHLLYLGFAFGESEVHLRALVQWLDEQVSGARTHWLPLGSSQVRARRSDLEFFENLGNVEVVRYDDRAGHGAAVTIALALAPRGYDRTEDPRVDERITWVAPGLVVQKSGEDHADLERRMWSFDFLGSGGADIRGPDALGDIGRSVVIAAPGMGKTKLVQWLPYRLGGQCAVGQFRNFHPADPDEKDRGILRILTAAGSGERISVDDWLGKPLTVILDGLDELDLDSHPAALEALKEMALKVPQHRVIVTTRPVPAVKGLTGLDFDAFHILPSRRWAEKYLKTRALSPDLISRALAVNTLGDLAVIPLFSELLADRLLDSARSLPEALRLLVESQLHAIERWATRAEVQRAPLEAWLRELALGLQLRGRTSISTAELPDQNGSGGSDRAMERLRQASVLGDRAEEASFARRTFQEALVADSILTHQDPVSALEWSAVALVNGRKTIRDDFDFVADLVFEHATKADRGTLRALDPERWARTVALRGTLEDGRCAFRWIETWHRQRGVSYLNPIDRSLLRSLEATIDSICRRWPEIVRNRKKRLIRDLAGGTEDARARALTALGTLPLDSDTERWLMPCLSDSNQQIVATAAYLVSRHRLLAAVPQLIEHLKSSSASVRRAALRALIDVLPGGRLTELAPHLGPQDPPGPFMEDLAERLNLDEALAFLASLRVRSSTSTWLLDRLIQTTPIHAWTDERIKALMAALAVTGLQPDPDYAAMAVVLETRLGTAFAALHPTQLGQPSRRWYLPRGQGEALLAVDDATLLAANPPPEIQQALEAERHDREDRKRHERREHDAQAELVAKIDRDGDAIDLATILGDGPLNRVDARQRDTLSRAVGRAWPTSGLTVGGAYDSDPAIDVGQEIKAAITREHWIELLESHLRSSGSYGLGRAQITQWLASTRPPNITPELIKHLTACDNAEPIPRLLYIAGTESPDVVSAVHKRLLQLAPDDRAWLVAARQLIDTSMKLDTASLLSHAGPLRPQLVSELARKGDQAARKEILLRMTEQIASGEDPESPSWPDATYDASFTPLLADLATSADDRSNALQFAVNALGQIGDQTSATVLERLAVNRSGIWWIEHVAVRAAARLATTQVVNRLDDDIFSAAREFLAL